jgi:Recombinase
MLTHPVYAGRMPFNRMDARSRRRKSEAEQVFAKVPAVIEAHVFAEVQSLLKARNPRDDCSPRGERTHPADWPGGLRHLPRRDDAQDGYLEVRQGAQVLRLLKLRPEGKDGMQGQVDPDGQARRARDDASG